LAPLPLATGALDGLPLLAGVCVPDVAPLLGVAALELLPLFVYAWPATAPVAVEPRCEKSYAIAPPRTRVAMTFSVMNTIATRSLIAHLPGRTVASLCETPQKGLTCMSTANGL
jgi:hypothetical protein